MGGGLGMVRSIEVGRYLHMAAHGRFLIGGCEGFCEMEAASRLRDVGTCGKGGLKIRRLDDCLFARYISWVVS